MKVQNEMSTRISVDAVAAIGSMSAFRNAIRGASDAWRAQETALRNSGNYTEAATARIRGLNQVIDLQKAKVSELRQRQEGLDTSNQKQAAQFLKLERQIQQANRQLSSYESQATKARNAARYQASGLAELQASYRRSQSASAAYVARLTAEGRSASATVERYRQLRSSLINLESQYRKQEFMLRQVANESGKDSEAYVKQREQLDKTAASIAKTRTEMRSLSSEEARLRPTGINRIDNAVVKLNDQTAQMRTRMRSAFDAIKNNAMGIAGTIGTIGAAMVSSARKAGAIQKTMVENQNLMTTAGEKSAAAQREVNQMYSDGEKYSVQYGVSQKTIADGYQELIKRGYDGRQSLGAMKSILEASRASGDDFNDTMKVTTSTLEAFGMRSETTAGMMRNTAQAADVLAKAADVTSTSFKSIGVGMEYAGSSAKQSGVSMRETAAALGVLSNNGLEASQAGTGLQRILSRLSAPTSTATAELKKYNLSIDDFKTKSGQLKPISAIFQDINAHVPKAERLEVFNKVFGQTAQNAAGILSRTAALNRENSQSLQHVEDQLKTAYSEDYVGKMARRNMNSAKNSSDRFKYAVQAIQIEIGRNMLPAISRASAAMANAFAKKDTQQGLKTIAKGIGDVANAAVSMLEFLGKHTTTVKVFGAALLAAFGAAKLLDAIGTTRKRIDNLRAVISKIPIHKKTTVEADTATAKRNVDDVKSTMDRVPKTKTSKVDVDTRQANTNVNTTKRGLETIPRTKTSRVNVDTRQATTNIKEVGVASKTAATTSKISFASIKAAGVSSISAIGMAVRANPLGALITGIQLASVAFSALYNHSKTFRRFVNGLASTAKSGMKKVGNFFTSGFRSIGRAMQNNTKTQQRAQRQQVRQQEQANRQMQRSWNSFSRTTSRTVSNMWRGIGRTASNGWRGLTRTANNGGRTVRRTWNNMSRTVGRTSQTMWRALSRGATNGWRTVERAAQNGSNRVHNWYERLRNNTSRTVQAMAREHPRTFQAMYKTIEDRSKMWHDLTSGHWNRLSDDTQDIAKDMSNESRSIFSDMYDKLNSITGGRLGDILNAWKKHFSDVIGTITSSQNPVHSAFMGVLRGIATPFSNIIKGIANGINWIADKIGGSHISADFSLNGFAKGTPNGGILHNQIALLNDGDGPHYQEMVHKAATGKTFMLPAKRNIIMPLEKGDEVLDGENSHRLANAMHIAIPHASGAIGDFFSGVFNAAKDAAEDAMDWVDKALKNVVEFGTELFHHFVEAVPGSKDNGHEFSQDLHNSLPGYFARIGQAWLKKQLEQMQDDNGDSITPEMIRKAAALVHETVSDSEIQRIINVAVHESGNRSRGVQNNWDSNAKAGTPSKGVLQFIDPTFNTYAVKGHHDIWKAFDQVLALLNDSNWRSDIHTGGWGPTGAPRGYADGGLVSRHGLYEVAEGNNPEMIIPLDQSKRGRAYDLLSQVIARFKSEDSVPANSDNQQIQIISKKFDTVLSQNQQLINLLDKLIGVTDSANDPTARYKRTQRDVNLAQIQSFI
ncbi:phage tail tape measure protein [Limosilactobacillus difficilis]|uniref:phage tail tape measure protein n=1 Tax=Limosilactobacillus difficilis TaxID=2991838 RepID=UPI0024BACB66|nr:phage tail tape measure protein [Limosilactobacillus difficilis]